MRLFILLLFATFIISSCAKDDSPLPIYGFKQVVEGDTIYQKTKNFDFLNQDGQAISSEDLNDHLMIVDFFYINCPTICPTVQSQMYKIYDRFADKDLVRLASFTLDPKRDSLQALKQYAEAMEIDTDKWYFISGDKDSTYDVAASHFVVAYEAPDVPGGFDHSGKIVLVDKEQRVRAHCDGTDPTSIKPFFADVEKLIKEYQQP